MPVFPFAFTLPSQALIRFILALLLSITGSVAFGVEPVDGDRQARAIINGRTATQARPWMAALLRSSTSTNLSDRQFCGGALVASTWVLTAAHCIDGVEPDSVEVLLGRLDLTDSKPVLHETVEFIKHPYYQNGSRFYDIALIRLATPSSNRSIAIATEAMMSEAQGNPLQVFGWGTTQYDDTAECTMHFVNAVENESDFICKTWVYQPSTKSSVLMETEVTLQPYEQCDRRYKGLLDKLDIPYGSDPLYSDVMTPHILCAWDAQDASMPCFGDSGGPVVRNVGGTERLFGIVSAGLLPDCTLAEQISFFTNAPYFTSFVGYTLNRGLMLGASRLCPGRITPTITYSARHDGRHDVKVSWNRDSVANRYRVFYASHASMGTDVHEIDVQGRTEISTVLATGQKFFVAVQGRVGRCDGPLSSVVMVKVP